MNTRSKVCFGEKSLFIDVKLSSKHHPICYISILVYSIAVVSWPIVLVLSMIVKENIFKTTMQKRRRSSTRIVVLKVKTSNYHLVNFI